MVETVGWGASTMCFCSGQTFVAQRPNRYRRWRQAADDLTPQPVLVVLLSLSPAIARCLCVSRTFYGTCFFVLLASCL